MKVMLLRDVYKLGRAGDVKKVADGYGRNYLIPQGFALLATPGAVKQADQIRKNAVAKRTALNNELSGVAELVKDLVLPFTMKAGENGKLYGSITNQMVADAINGAVGTQIDRHQIEIQPIRTIGEHKATVRLTVDLVPAVKIVVHREGETTAAKSTKPAAAKPAPAKEEAAPAEAPEASE
jgi:large subunit ribosomal protein L9